MGFCATDRSNVELRMFKHPSCVFPRRNGLKMRRIATFRVTAQVINDHAIGDFPVCLFVREPMRLVYFT
jgi:hypothetical protein